MKENTQEKKLIEKKEGFFGKIKNFFKNLFSKKAKDIKQEEVISKETVTNEFKESIKTEESEESKLLDIQKRYRRGEIAENDLTEEQIDALCDLYDRQIEVLRKAIEEKEQQIAENDKEKIEKKNA